MLPVGSKDFDNGGNHHEDLDGPERGFTAKPVDGPTADEQDDDQGSSISG